MKRFVIALASAAVLTACGSKVNVDTPSEPTNIVTEEALTESGKTEEEETLSEPEVNAEDADFAEDISLRTDKTEIVADEDDNEIIFYAEIPVDFSPEKLELVDADTGEAVAELFDEADFEKYGDTIKGDSVYNCRFKVNTDINIYPDVSEDKQYHYYARFDGHRSNIVEIAVFEQFTDKELGDMEEVDKVLAGMTNSGDFKKMSEAEKRERALEVLNTLAENGTADRPYSLIKKESIYSGDGDVVTFEYACGVGGGVMFKEFDPNLN